MPYRIFNFNPGPATLPLEVLEEAREEMLNYRNTGLSIMEMSHRSPEFEEIIDSAQSLFLELAELSTAYQVLFLQGGASLQFSMIPFNFLTPDTTADYIITGSFAKKAMQEAAKIGNTNVAASNDVTNYTTIPRPEDITLSPNSAYLHFTTNNTIYGTQWNYVPDSGTVPLIADMSSDILSRKIEMHRFALVYAGAQKNLGPAGVTAVIIHKSLLEKASASLPAMLSYKTHAENGSLFNTPPCFPIYIVKLVLEWIKKKGGLSAIQETNEQKADLLYQAIDNSGGYYIGHAAKEDRSIMNVTFRLPEEGLEKTFLEEAAAEGLKGLKGHRSVGGIRASIYNAMPYEGCEALAQFMKEFPKKH